MAERPRAIVVGAGIAGLSAALRLHQIGWEPTVVELASARREGGYVITVFGAGYDAAERIGVLPALQDRDAGPFALRYVRADGRHHFTVPRSTVAAVLGPRALTFLRGDLEDVLYQAVHDKVEIRFGTTVESVTQDERAVHAVLSDGTGLDADLLVAADGLHSSVRHLVFGPEERFRLDLNHVVTAFPLDQLPDGLPEGAATTLSAVGRTAIVTGLGPGRTAAFLIHRTDEPAGELGKGPRRAVDDAFGDLGWLIPDLRAQLGRVDSVYFDMVSQVVVDRWSHGRVVLLGDAAWCVTLFAGHGASLALTGADHLATSLREHGVDVPAALTEWEARLRPSVEARQRRGRRSTAAHSPASQLELAVRNLGLRLASLAPVRQLLRHRLKLHR
jgi:2-polyprenyl-6-methoxyphenol hydroxylase-like FAD-dependent oxidoreductase